MTVFVLNATIRTEKGATDRRLVQYINYKKSNHSFGRGGYFFVPIIDAGGAVEDVINKLSPEAARGYYNDNWHLLQQGHQIYADAIIKELDKIL